VSVVEGAIDAVSERLATVSRRTTFGIGGPADLLVTAHRASEVTAVLQVVADVGVPLFVLGGGSNLLVADDGIRGVTLCLGGELAQLTVLEGGAAIRCGAAVTYPRLTRTALELGWASAVGWIGTPGQVGGALLMNAGSREGEISDVVESVETCSARGIQMITKEGCQFRYRGSLFQQQSDDSLDQESFFLNSTRVRAREVLTSTILRCDNRETMAASLQSRAQELLEKRHRSQPKLRSAGSIFKNPPGDFAGRLIEACGLKGAVVGAAQISDVHANFIVNRGGARAADVLSLAAQAQHAVLDRFHVSLEWEVRRVGTFAVMP
jgi:UDP-N-acetylmuramate dehydrogenase